MIKALLSQDIFNAPGIDVRILVLANGCTDETVPLAMALAVPPVEVADLAQGGKSRSWNRFVHDLSRRDVDVLFFCDADIGLPQSDTLRLMATRLAMQPQLVVMNSRPVKDIVFDPVGLGLVDRFIALSGGGLDDWKTAICGQLYAMPAVSARRFHLPVGLPVEDGFLRAMVLTDCLTTPALMERIHGEDQIFHVYRSERKISNLIRHQVRIVIGSAINFAVFRHMRAMPPGQRNAMLADAAADSHWLENVLRQHLPAGSYGYVPFHFLTKRLQRAFENPKGLLRPRRLASVTLGFGFDAVVYIAAQWKMWRGAGAGYW